MREDRLVDVNEDKAAAVERRLRELGEDDADVIRRLSADLSDVYAGALRYRELLDAFLEAPPEERDRLGDALADLRAEMGHLRHHLRQGVGLMGDLTGGLD